MKLYALVLVLLNLPTLLLAQQQCVAGSTRDSGCFFCASSAPDSDCQYCEPGYWKSGAKACTACPKGSGRDSPQAPVEVETNAVCKIKSAPQIDCLIANSTHTCQTCATGSYLETGLIEQSFPVSGCSKDCKSFFSSLTNVNMLPATETPASLKCAACSSNCAKCEFAPTLKPCEGSSPRCAADQKQTTACTECKAGYYLVPNKDTKIVPSCQACGPNCKTCKDFTECNSCLAGWAMDGTDKSGCFKPAPTASANIFQIAVLSLLALLVVC